MRKITHQFILSTFASLAIHASPEDADHQAKEELFVIQEWIEADTMTITELTFADKLNQPALLKESLEKLITENKARRILSSGQIVQLGKESMTGTFLAHIAPTEYDPPEIVPEFKANNGKIISPEQVIPAIPVCFEERPLGERSIIWAVKTAKKIVIS